jgi:DNA sulfur modification protein DndC
MDNSERPYITKELIKTLTERIQELYLSDKIPWIVGYSGGKDSTATLQLVWYAIASLSPEKHKHKTIHVISTDTLVESPVVAAWVNLSLERMKVAAEEQNLPFTINRLTPKITDSFWVNLIGKGYPAPRPNFRWCTDRLKISPSNKFTTEVVAKHGEVILLLGTRTAESSIRAATMKKYEQKRIRDWLSPTKNQANCLVFTPIEEWSNDNVWVYLMQYSNPWGQSNKDLLTMYRGASADNECPLVVDTDTPSCGSSRFGCWVCTMVKEDKSMQAMIQNDEEKVWMTPLLEFRNEFGDLHDRDKRDFRKMGGRILIFHDRAVHGPYTKYWREHWLERLLEVEKEIKRIGPPGFNDMNLVSDEELRWIRRIWVLEKHEFEDSLPRIYEKATGKKYKYLDDIKTILGSNEWDLLKNVCGSNDILFELQTNLLGITQQYMSLSRRKGVLQELEEAIKRCYFESEEEAVNLVMAREKRLDHIRDTDLEDLLMEGTE